MVPTAGAFNLMVESIRDPAGTYRGSDANTGVSNNGYIHCLMRACLDISITGPSAVCLYPLLQPGALAHILVLIDVLRPPRPRGHSMVLFKVGATHLSFLLAHAPSLSGHPGLARGRLCLWGFGAALALTRPSSVSRCA